MQYANLFNNSNRGQRYQTVIVILAMSLSMIFAGASLQYLQAEPPEGKTARKTATKPAIKTEAEKEPAKAKVVLAKLPKLPDGAKPLNKKQTIWIDVKGKRIFLVTTVVKREGLLEMICCLKQRKEHESIISLDGKAAVVHAGLLALGIEAGEPPTLYPKYEPPKGPLVDLHVHWNSRPRNGKVNKKKETLHRADVRSWVQTATRKYFTTKLTTLPKGIKLPEEPDLRFDKKFQELFFFGTMTKKDRDTLLALSAEAKFQAAVNELHKISQPKPMTSQFLFTGSVFDKNPETGKVFYLAEGGRFITTANFVEAMIDVKEKSSGDNAQLSYEAISTKVPPLGTPVLLEISLHPIPKKKQHNIE